MPKVEIVAAKPRVLLDLSAEEAAWLLEMTQNHLGPEKETIEEHAIRESLYLALRDAKGPWR